MRWPSYSRMACRLVGFVVLVVLAGGGGAKADFTFGKPTVLEPPINKSGYTVYGCSFSSDGLGLYVSTGPAFGDAGGEVYGCRDIWVSTRETVKAPWGKPVNLGPNVNYENNDYCPAISPDGLELYFMRGWFGTPTSPYICVSKRPSKNAPWGATEPLGPPFNSHSAGYPKFSADGRSLYFSSIRPGGSGGYDLWVTTRATTTDPWSEPVNLGPSVNTGLGEYAASMSSDGRVLFFDVDWAGSDRSELWVVIRATRDADWGPPRNLGRLINLTSWTACPELSPDGSTLYFTSGRRPGGYGGTDLCQVKILPIVDFNGDGKVDGTEVLALAKHWGQNESLYDIGLPPIGDGVVDINDLTVLAGYIGQELDDPTLLAHWAMDETDGIVVHDQAGANNGTIMGLPQWRPQGGKVTGALELNGATFVTAKSVLSPADGPFSVLGWIKGGAPGQTVISQGGSADWLTAYAATGALATELSKDGRTGSGLSSQAIITDGNWHRIAFTWDGSWRRLYVDDVLVAADVHDSLAAASGNLVLGTGKTMAPGTFWKGLIDDVRIYNRAVKPSDSAQDSGLFLDSQTGGNANAF